MIGLSGKKVFLRTKYYFGSFYERSGYIHLAFQELNAKQLVVINISSIQRCVVYNTTFSVYLVVGILILFLSSMSKGGYNCETIRVPWRFSCSP